MKKKYVITLTIIGILIMVVGVTYAYFTAKSLTSGEGSSVTVTTATLEDVGLTIEGQLTFEDTDILPGHQNISSIKVTASGDNKIVTYDLVWKGINTLQTPLKYYVYKTTKEEHPQVVCTKKQSGSVNFRQYYETCEKIGFENLGKELKTGFIDSTDVEKTFKLMLNEAIKGTDKGNSVYYYVILEFQNLPSDQTEIDKNGNFNGKVTVEETTETLADITITNIQKVENGELVDIEKQPDKKEGYTLDLDQSSCEKQATLNWSDSNYSLSVNVKQPGTTCNLVFKKKPTAEDTLKNLGIETEGIPEATLPFTDIACGDSDVCKDSLNGLVKGEDDDGTTYYYRGNVNNNWVKFANMYWRIIRINGDGTIRLIYSGDTAQTIGTGTQINGSSGVAFNTNRNDNKYVGYMYDPSGNTVSTADNYPPKTNSSSTKSAILNRIEDWYNEKLKSGYSDKIDIDAGFCGDRSLAEKNHGESYTIDGNRGYGANTTVYGPADRVWRENSTSYATSITPTFGCKNNTDLYTMVGSSKGNQALPVPVGLITMDEVIFAGGYPEKANDSGGAYYLYTNQNYWTMSPSYWNNSNARVFYVVSDGSLGNNLVNDNRNVRPVINLKANTTFSNVGGGDVTVGTMNKPYEVA